MYTAHIVRIRGMVEKVSADLSLALPLSSFLPLYLAVARDYMKYSTLAPHSCMWVCACVRVWVTYKYRYFIIVTTVTIWHIEPQTYCSTCFTLARKMQKYQVGITPTLRVPSSASLPPSYTTSSTSDLIRIFYSIPISSPTHEWTNCTLASVQTTQHIRYENMWHSLAHVIIGACMGKLILKILELSDKIT